MSFDTTPYDGERMSLGALVEPVAELASDADSDAVSEFVLEHLLDMLSLDEEEEEDVDTTSNLARPPMSDPEIFEWQWDIPDTSLIALHTARTPVHLQAERSGGRASQLHTLSGPNCWIGLSVGWPQTDISFRRFGMVHWSHTPYISISSPYTLPRTFLYLRTSLGSLNGIPEYDTAEPSSLFYPDSLLPLPPL